MSEEVMTMESGNNKLVKVLVSWETDVAQTIHEMMSARNVGATMTAETQPLLVGLVGVPGSGKTTSASILAQMLVEQGCMVIPMDGYHYPISMLQSFPVPEDAIYRRGAPDTFDSMKLHRDLERIKYGSEEEEVYIPGFDHALGDPEPNKYCFIRQRHKIVICEGLYLLHWSNNNEHHGKILFDLLLYISADVDACIARLKERNTCIPGYTPEEIDLRCDVIDRANAEIVELSKTRAHRIVHSKPT